MTDLPTVSVLIGTRDRPFPLTRCIKSILEQDYSNLEVIVFDDCSEQEKIAEVVASQVDRSSVQFVRSAESLGVAGGRNLLMQEASGEFMVVVDDDALFPNTHDISRIVETFDKHPDGGMTATKVVEPGGDETDYLLPFPKRALNKNPGLMDAPSYISYFVGACHAFRRSVAESLPGYESDLVYGLEESFFSYRALQSGVKLMYIPDAMIHHMPEPSVVANAKRGDIETYYGIRNRIWFGYQFLPMRYLLIYWTLWVGFFGIRSVRTLQLFPFSRGVLRGFASCRGRPRTPINGSEVTYLKKHHGRLYY